jgi:hypothetical protein
MVVLAMTLFSFAWVFLFYLFWRSVSGGRESTGGFLALFFGLITALVQRFAGPPYPGAFGFLRWISSFVDLAAFPLLLPLGLCLLFLVLNIFSGSLDLTNFLLIWLLPCSLFRALSLESFAPPLESVFVPLLWTSLAVGMPFFIYSAMELYGMVRILSIAGCVLLPFAGVTAYWAFFGQRFFLAWSLAALTLLPMASSMTFSFIRAQRHG